MYKVGKIFFKLTFSFGNKRKNWDLFITEYVDQYGYIDKIIIPRKLILDMGGKEMSSMDKLKIVDYIL